MRPNFKQGPAVIDHSSVQNFSRLICQKQDGDHKWTSLSVVSNMEWSSHGGKG